MARSRNQEFFGLFLAVLGTLFLLVNNHLLWFGWETLWPAIPFLIGIFLVRVYTRRRKPRQLFLGVFLTLSGIFFFLFTSGILPWDTMEVLWPTIPLMIGIALLVLSVGGSQAAPPIVFGLVLVVFAFVSYLAEAGVIERRISQPLVRIWPLFLVAAGILIYLRARRERTTGDAGYSEPSSHAETSPDLPQGSSDS